MVSIPKIFTEYITGTEITPLVKQHICQLQEHDWLSKPVVTYFDLIIVISLRYIQGQALESLSSKFSGDCQKINSIACEILELFTTRIPEKSVDIASFVYEPLLVIEAHALMNKNYVIQV